MNEREVEDEKKEPNKRSDRIKNLPHIVDWIVR